MAAKKALEERAKELEEVAAKRKVDWQKEVADLPADDPIAKIGLLASMLKIDLGLALDPGVPLADTNVTGRKSK